MDALHAAFHPPFWVTLFTLAVLGAAVCAAFYAAGVAAHEPRTSPRDRSGWTN